MECGMESGLCYTLVQLVTPSVQEFGETASEVWNTTVVPDVIDQWSRRVELMEGRSRSWEVFSS